MKKAEFNGNFGLFAEKPDHKTLDLVYELGINT